MAKRDNRKDNAVHLQQHIDHTIANLQEAEEYLEEFGDEISPDERKMVEEKNERRRNSIEAFIAEKKDESRQNNE